MIRFLQEQLPQLWTNEAYSKEFNAIPSQHKDFQHALLHIMKTTGKLASMVEEVDHMRCTLYFPKELAEKYLADLVICALRMAIKNPTGEIDLEKAVFDRIEEKMGVKLAQ